jgi:hypothetical protein
LIIIDNNIAEDLEAKKAHIEDLKAKTCKFKTSEGESSFTCSTPSLLIYRTRYHGIGRFTGIPVQSSTVT